MRQRTIVICSGLMLGLLVAGAQGGISQSDPPQSDQPVTGASAEPTISAMAVSGQPFSATKYHRTVRILPDGSQVILSERAIMKLARDTEGRVRIEDVDGAPECEQLGSLALKKCPVKYVVVFDPAAMVITHWPEGEMAGHAAIVVKLSPEQVEDGASSTLNMQEGARDIDSSGATVTTVNLGEKIIEGIRATGVRTTTVFPAGYSGNKEPIKTIHEVWASAEMKLVVKIVDGDPRKEETVSGLEHCSLAPDPALFQPPAEYEVQYRDQSQYAESDKSHLAEWGFR